MQQTETQIRLDLDNGRLSRVAPVVKGFGVCHINGKGSAGHGGMVVVKSTTKSRVLAAWTMDLAQQTVRSRS